MYTKNSTINPFVWEKNLFKTPFLRWIMKKCWFSFWNLPQQNTIPIKLYYKTFFLNHFIQYSLVCTVKKSYTRRIYIWFKNFNKRWPKTTKETDLFKKTIVLPGIFSCKSIQNKLVVTIIGIKLKTPASWLPCIMISHSSVYTLVTSYPLG